MKERINWKKEIETVKCFMGDGYSLDDIAQLYNVSRIRIYQVLQRFEVNPPHKIHRLTTGRLKLKQRWLNRILLGKKIDYESRMEIVSTLNIPDRCPILGIAFDFTNSVLGDNSPSVDRIDSTRGYLLDNVHIISWRANRIKNDSTIQELILITNYLQSLYNK